jgi:ABC-type branched-subunit amino acid transport system ATPase component
VIAAIFGAIAGGLAVVGDTQLNSTQVDWQLSTRALIVVLLGGTSFFLGPFAGALFYTFMLAKLIETIGVLWDTVLGIVVLAVALLAPAGISGLIHWLLAQAVVLRDRLRGGAVAARAPAVALATDGREEVHLPELSEVGVATAMSPDGHGPPVLEIKSLTKSFGGLVAVHDVSLHVRKGAIHAIIGPNGAGKTTLFNLITGLHKPDSGQVLLEGEDITGGEPWKLVKRGIGRSFQQTNLFWELSALKNVTIAGSAAVRGTRRVYGAHPPGVVERAAALLDRVGLAAFGQTGARELSHGDQRSLEIATALAVESRFLLLDEPTAGISPAETRTAVELIRKIAREENLTVLFVEHDMEVVFRIADWITVMHYGAVLAEGTPAEIRANPDVQRAYLGEITEEEVAG